MNQGSQKTLITIVGPTAIGKTALAIKIAQHFNTEIISCDSRQFYNEMCIGTAVPNKDELNAVQHHFIQSRSIYEDYSVGDFEKDALLKLDELFRKHNVVVMTGGSGLYVNAVLKGFDNFPKIDSSVRESLKEKLQIKGLEYLQNKLKELDPITYQSIALDNPNRVIRVLEVCIGSGKPYSSFLNKIDNKRNFNSIQIGISADREIIYNRINKRVDIMMELGLLEEAKKLYNDRELNALQTVGYRELFSYFDGTFTKEFAIEEIKKNTRRFAKRQLTWFRKDSNINWFNYQAPLPEIISTIEKNLNVF